jgi:hypothetical protein
LIVPPYPGRSFDPGWGQSVDTTASASISIGISRLGARITDADNLT